MGKEAKTNAMRMLERAKIAYTAHEYPHEEGQAVDEVVLPKEKRKGTPLDSSPIRPER